MMSPILERQMLETGAASVLVKGLAACTEFEISCAMIDALATLASRKVTCCFLIPVIAICTGLAASALWHLGHCKHNSLKTKLSHQNLSIGGTQ